MFVRQSTYDKAVRDAIESNTRSLRYQLKYVELLRMYNRLVTQINDKGGQTFLEGKTKSANSTTLTQTQIKSLIQLCHPDKHDGKQSAIELTQVLLKLRK